MDEKNSSCRAFEKYTILTCVQSVSSSTASSKAELQDEMGEDDGEGELELLH